MQTDIAVVLVGIALGFVLGHYLRAATIARLTEPTALWSALAAVFVFFLSGGTSWIILTGLDSFFNTTSITLFESIAFGIALLNGGFAGIVYPSWQTLQASSRQIAKKVLLCWGAVVIVWTGVAWYFDGWEATLYAILGLSAGFLLGVLLQCTSWQQQYSRLLNLLLRPVVVSCGSSVIVGVTLANSILLPRFRSPANVSLLLIGLSFGLLCGVCGLFFPRVRRLSFTDVCNMLRMNQAYQNIDGAIPAHLTLMRYQLERARIVLPEAAAILSTAMEYLKNAEQALQQLPTFCERPLSEEERAALIYNVQGDLRPEWTPAECEQILIPALDRWRCLSRNIG
jgi:hypothetical protein